jgi:hypothetical protein
MLKVQAAGLRSRAHGSSHCDSMGLISWNLNGRRAKAAAQIGAILEREPDVVALQEVTRTTLPVLRAALAEGGLTQFADSFSLAPRDFLAAGLSTPE